MDSLRNLFIAEEACEEISVACPFAITLEALHEENVSLVVVLGLSLFWLFELFGLFFVIIFFFLSAPELLRPLGSGNFFDCHVLSQSIACLLIFWQLFQLCFIFICKLFRLLYYKFDFFWCSLARIIVSNRESFCLAAGHTDCRDVQNAVFIEFKDDFNHVGAAGSWRNAIEL